MTADAASDSEMYYEKGYFPIFYDVNNRNTFDSIKSNLPPGTPSTITVNGSVFPFNYRLWFSKNIVVYGDYATANPRANDFKAETDSPHNVGYYSKNSVRGEYRYHGFDVAGNRYNNTWWTVDVDTGSSINDNVWLYRPWNKDAYGLENISPYNEAAEWPRNQEDQKTKAWINRPIQKDGVTLTFENAENASEREAYRYINVMSPPTVNYPGEGKAWFKYNNQLLYRTFTLDKLDHVDKLMTDVEATITVLTPDWKLIVNDYGKDNPAEYLNGEVEVEVLVEGILKDEEFYNDLVKKVVRYTRFDIKDWTISLGSDIKDNVHASSYNKGSAVFKLKFKRSAIFEKQEYSLNGSAKANFINDKSNQRSGNNILKFTVNRILSIIDPKEMTGVETEIKVLTPDSKLIVTDYGENNTFEYLDTPIEFEFLVEGTLKDEEYYNDPVQKEKYYTRADIKDWNISLDIHAKDHVTTNENKGSASFKARFKIADILKNQEYTLKGNTRANFTDNINSENSASTTLKFKVIKESGPPEIPAPPRPVEPPPPPPKPPITVIPDCEIPHPAFDILPYEASDNTDLSKVSSRTVYINNEQVNDIEFFSGNYVFGDGQDGMKKIDVLYVSIDGMKSSFSKWVYVYDTKPNAQFKINGTFKQNRKLTVEENTGTGNVDIVTEKYPIVTYDWKFTAVDGDISSLRMRNLSDFKKEFMYKKPGVYRAELIVANTLGRTSKPYTFDFVIYEDVAPAIQMNIWNGVLTRMEELDMHYMVSSTDKDTIANKTLQLYYDSNNDGTCEKLAKTFANGEFTSYAPDKLGKYKLVATATEDFGQETLEEYITAADKKKKTIESEFWVDNLIPMTSMYISTPVVMPEADLYIMMDKNLSSDRRNFITSNRVNFDNTLRTKNILPQVKTWDMKTYIDSQSASDTYYSGTSTPPSSISYSSGGYSGTLDRDDYDDNGGYEDFGKWVNKETTVTRTESSYFSASHDNTVTSYYFANGSSKSYDSSPAPSSYYISEDGYSGSIPRTGTSEGPQYHYVSPDGSEVYEQTFTAHYGGTLTKTVTETEIERIWEPDMRWVSDYVGFYSGTIYSEVRQSYSNPFRATSDKYIVYISDGSVNELSDLKMVMSKADTKLILVGNSIIKSQINHDYYISKDKDIDKIMGEILDYVTTNSPAIEKYYVLAELDTFDIKIMDFDEESDLITEKKFQYVQNQNYFDNPTGMESFATASFSEDSNWIDTKANKFNTVGEYRIFRRIKDRPSTDPNFANYSYYSGTPELRIYAHRKPIARATLDWDYDSSKNTYKTRWVCQSYDLDHHYSREDKGIVDRKIMFRRTGGEWCYYIPEELSSGTYELKYYVKDVEGVWSDPFTMNFTLAAAPSIQFLDAKLRTLDPGFSLDSIPASEYLEIYDAWTRYPNNIKLEMALYNESTRVSPVKTVNYGSATGTKTGNDIIWRNISYQIPSTVKDGTYTFKIKAIDVGDSSKREGKSFAVTVNTPIDLVPSISEKVMTGTTIDIKAATKKYTGTTKVTIFCDTSYQASFDLIGNYNGNIKTWANKYSIPSDIPEGTYKAKFIATVPSGKSETKDVTFKVEALRITNVTIEGYWNHWRGQEDVFGKQLTNEPHRFLSLERVRVNVMTDGYADKIQIRFSPELEEMQYIDENGSLYDYKDDFGLDYVSFPQTFELDNANRLSQIHWEYVLPLVRSTKSWEDERTSSTYYMEVTAWNGTTSVKYVIDDIDITGNIYDLTYIQPTN